MNTASSICHDAAYNQVTFDGYQAPSILQVPGAKDVALEFNTLSKSHNMAGWRTAAAVGNSQALSALYVLKTNLDSGHFLPVMQGALAALTGDQTWLVERNLVYQQRRDAVMDGLRRIGIHAKKPLGSLYVWAAIPDNICDTEFVTAALESARVSFTPGSIW